jgi:hypothetical protein
MTARRMPNARRLRRWAASESNPASATTAPMRARSAAACRMTGAKPGPSGPGPVPGTAPAIRWQCVRTASVSLGCGGYFRRRRPWARTRCV